MFFNGFTMLLMMIAGGIGYSFSRWSISTPYLVQALSERVGSYYDNEGQVVIYTGLYEPEVAEK
jgi:hypothetical protein